MPTENRSSNTEMVSVPRVLTREMLNGVCMHPDLARSLWSALLKNAPQPAPQPNPEPIAWMVGTAIWWTKEEAERDAAATGLHTIAVGPITNIKASEQHQGEPVAPAFVMPSSENSYGFGYVDGTCIQSLRGYRDHLEDIVDAIPEGPLYTHADPGEVERLRAVIEQQRSLIASLREELVESRSIDARAEPGPTIWDCRPCQLEQPTDRPCDVCGGKTELAGAKS
ncbi:MULTISPECIES: hypothetical protein [unclassified Pseudomonas]|uniref:hypothetical protein n=1 Tax=unclassified Pseudomonas TaxID=196821 RepID=UPI00380119F6